VVLTELANTPPQERLAALYLKNEADWEPGTIVRRVAEQGSYTDEDVSAYRAAYAEHRKKLTSKDAAATLAIWADHAAYGERLLSALRSYYEVFFVEEERRIRPALKAALDDAQEKAARMNFDELIEDLSQGVAFDVTDPGDETDTVILAPSFWSAPLIWFGNVDQHTRVIYFGARPANASLVPGEVVPDALVSVLKALSDPTRLRIMHYLATDSLTPTQLANRLRLRPPTVVHHLKVMRLAGLVRVRISEGKEKSYAARTETVESTFEILRGFIKFGGSDLVGLASSFAEENSS
jgi:DNA-binding transcriptional ArsR family regulator